MPKRIILIDGDQFLFKAAVAVERETRWDDINHVLYSNPDEAWELCQDMIGRVFDRFETKDHALAFTTEPNFRKTLEPTYKAGRSPRKPLCYALLREKVETEYNCVSMPGLEADDVMGILATKPGRTKRIIVSQDKDMRTIPVDVWNGKDLYQVTPEDADRFHLYQTLVGDTSDGYKGCPGIGPKTAEKILQLSGALQALNARGQQMERWYAVVNAFKKAGLTEDDALKQARLARILRWDDWDQDKKEPILWTPVTP